MKKKAKKIIAIITACIVILTIVCIVLLVYKPWKNFENVEDAVITDIKALQNVDGRLYVYGEDISEISILRDYENTPYQKLGSVTNAPENSTHAQNCLVISDVGGTVSLSDADYSYIYSLVYQHDWWLMYIGTNETHTSQFVSHNLGHEGEGNIGFILKNSQFGNYSNIWNEEDTVIYKNTNQRLLVERMLSCFLRAIKDL